MFEPKLGVSLHCISRELTPDMLRNVCASRIATLEITPTLFDNDTPEETKAMLVQSLRESDTRAASVHARFGNPYDMSSLDEGIRRRAIVETCLAVDLASELDAPIVVLHLSAEPVGEQERALRIEGALRALSEIEPHAGKAARKLAVELLPRSCLGNSVEELLGVLDRFGSETLGVCLDVNHLMDGFSSIPDAVRTLGGRLTTLHMSDYDGVDEKHWLPGRGVICWASFIAALRDIGYTGPFNYECQIEGETAGEKIRALEENFDWLSAL